MWYCLKSKFIYLLSISTTIWEPLKILAFDHKFSSIFDSVAGIALGRDGSVCRSAMGLALEYR